MERLGEERREREGERLKDYVFAGKKKKKKKGDVAGQDWLA